MIFHHWLADLDNIKENVAYGTSLWELIQTKDSEACIKPEQIQFEANQAYGRADNQAYESKLITKQNEAYALVDHGRSCEMR